MLTLRSQRQLNGILDLHLIDIYVQSNAGFSGFISLNFISANVARVDSVKKPDPADSHPSSQESATNPWYFLYRLRITARRRAQLDATELARLPDPLFLQLDHALSLPARAAHTGGMHKGIESLPSTLILSLVRLCSFQNISLHSNSNWKFGI